MKYAKIILNGIFLGSLVWNLDIHGSLFFVTLFSGSLALNFNFMVGKDD